MTGVSRGGNVLLKSAKGGRGAGGPGWGGGANKRDTNTKNGVHRRIIAFRTSLPMKVIDLAKPNLWPPNARIHG